MAMNRVPELTLRDLLGYIEKLTDEMITLAQWTGPEPGSSGTPMKAKLITMHKEILERMKEGG